MNTNHINDYFQIKADIAALNESIATKRGEIDSLKRKIADIHGNIKEIDATLESEDRLMELSSPLKKPTLTVDQFMAKRKEVAKMKAELPPLTEALEFLNKSISGLEGNLSITRGSLKAKVNLVAADLVDKAAEQLIATSGEPFRDLVMAVIAKQGMQQGYAIDSKNLFMQKTNSIVCEILYQLVFGKGNGGYVMPELHEANQHVISILEAMPITSTGTPIVDSDLVEAAA
ncbi:hypothetical protein [Methylomonas sp. MgM2]